MPWLVGNGAQRNIRVLNLSLGNGIEESDMTYPLVLAVEAVWDADTVYLELSSTATPAGTAALIPTEEPDLTPATMKSRFMSFACNVAGADHYLWVDGAMRADSVVNEDGLSKASPP